MASEATRPGRHQRRCGDCSACCTIMGVPEIEKPAGVACGHLCSRGCRIYTARPTECRTFACVWKEGAFPKDWRPDKVGFIIVAMGEGDDQTLALHLDPVRPLAWEAKAAALESLGRSGGTIHVALEGVARTTFDALGRRNLKDPK